MGDVILGTALEGQVGNIRMLIQCFSLARQLNGRSGDGRRGRKTGRVVNIPPAWHFPGKRLEIEVEEVRI